MTQPTDYTWIAHPDVVSLAIYVLASAVVLLGATAISLFLFIDANRMKKIDAMAIDISRIADIITQNALAYEHRLTSAEGRIDALEEINIEMKRLCEDRRNKGVHT